LDTAKEEEKREKEEIEYRALEPQDPIPNSSYNSSFVEFPEGINLSDPVWSDLGFFVNNPLVT
jgi:hypothetical protein